MKKMDKIMKDCQKVRHELETRIVMELCSVEHILWKVKLFSEYGEEKTKIQMMRERIDIGAREKGSAKLTVVLEEETTL